MYSLDPSILQSLRLPFPVHPSQIKFSPCGASGFTSCYKLTVQGGGANGDENKSRDGDEESREYFVKIAKEGDGEMLKGMYKLFCCFFLGVLHRTREKANEGRSGRRSYRNERKKLLSQRIFPSRA